MGSFAQEGSVRIQPLGPDGVQQRISEIQSRLEALRPATPAVGAPASGLSGPIGNGGGIAPVNPFGAGVRVVAPQAPAEIKGMIQNAAQSANIDPQLFEALVGVESDFNPRSVSSAGAMGLSQLMPGTAKLLGVSD